MKTVSGYEISKAPSAIKTDEAMGINVMIEINCETGDEILAHLSAIRQEVKRVLKKDEEVSAKYEWLDNNCYGAHSVAIDLYESAL